MDGFYALAAGALGPEAHRDRPMVVSPLFLAPENPRMPESALQLLRDGGIEVMGPAGVEDPEKATLYFTPPEALEDGRYALRVYVSLGARFGRMDRGDSWWQAVMIFAVSVIAIFCFSSVTQGWFIVKVKWYEGIALVVVMMGLFRPDMMMNQFYPPFAPASLDSFVAGEPVARPGYSIRLHLTRETDYGDRLKLYRLATPEIPPDPEFGLYGVKLEKTDDGRLEVVDLQRLGLAEQVGIQLEDVSRDPRSIADY